MEKIVGYVVSDATVKTFGNHKSVVNFTVAKNRFFTDKDGVRKQSTRFFDCSYWKNPEVAKFLVKGKVVELDGTIDVRAYIKTDDSGAQIAVGVLTVNVSEIGLFGHSEKHAAPSAAQNDPVQSDEEFIEDLPF
ncbi:MAG: single-stranded DNA-binding protein [Puia sp.]|nr:single-stranded DNA-binding protein [Puia sp.]